MNLRDYITAHGKDSPSVNKIVTVAGCPITIEYPKGSLRQLHDDEGKLVYSRHMYSHYGYINKTKGRDGDEVDVLVGPVPNPKEVYIVHMLDMGPDKAEREDEDKVMLGYLSSDAAKAAFLSHYPKNFFGGMTTLSLQDFKSKLATAQLPYRRKKITAGGPGSGRRPEAGTSDYVDMYGKPISNDHKASFKKIENRDAWAAHLRDKGWNVDTAYRPGKFGSTSNTDKPFKAHVNGFKKITAARATCPKCGSKKYGLMPTDFETAKCSECGKTFEEKANVHSSR